MSYKHLWKIALAGVIVISAIMVAPSVLKIYELPINTLGVLGMVDIALVFITVITFVKGNKE